MLPARILFWAFSFSLRKENCVGLVLDLMIWLLKYDIKLCIFDLVETFDFGDFSVFILQRKANINTFYILDFLGV
jgi:hypothetical protein